LTTQEFEAREDVEDEPEPEAELDAEATPLDAEVDAEADFYAAPVEEAEERVDSEFSADSLQLFLKDVGKVDLLLGGGARRVLEAEIAAGDGQECAVHVPENGAHLRQADQMRLGFGAVHRGGRRPGQVARVEVSGVLFEREGHVRPLHGRSGNRLSVAGR